MKKMFFLLIFAFSSMVLAQPPGPYNQTYTWNNNQHYGTDWYNSPLGMGAAQAGVMVIDRLFNLMTPAPPVQVIQAPAVPAQQIYVNPGPGIGTNPYSYGGSNGGPIPWRPEADPRGAYNGRAFPYQY